jgi:hypothetical protein
MAQEATEKHVFAAVGLKTVTHSMAVVTELEALRHRKSRFSAACESGGTWWLEDITSVIRETRCSGLIIRTLLST